MSNAYRELLEALLIRTRPGLAESYKLEFKPGFGAVAGYVEGNIFITRGKFGVALKLPRSILEELFRREGAEPLKYFEKGHVKKDYAVLSAGILENGPRFRELLDASIHFAVGPEART